MNLLLGCLPRSVDIAGREVPIVTDYRAGIKFEHLLHNSRLSNREKLEQALQLYFRNVRLSPKEYSAATDAILDFYRCGAPRRPRGECDDSGPEEAPAYSYEHDADYIYAAFMQAYGLDLTAEPHLHWWQFRALFKALPEDTMFMKIIGYRVAKIPPKASAEQRQRIEELKRIYALPLEADQQQLKTDLTAILLNGGNPAVLLSQQGADGECHTMAP